MPLFNLIFHGLGWPWVGEFDGFIIFYNVSQPNRIWYIANTLLPCLSPMWCRSPCLPRLDQLYPYECQERLVDMINTGDEITVDLSTDTLTNHASGEEKRPFSNGSMDNFCSVAAFPDL